MFFAFLGLIIFVFWFKVVFALCIGGTITFVPYSRRMIGPYMHVTTLDRMFVCQTCSVVIVFESDREQHERITGHSKFKIYDLTVGRDRTEYGDE
jgi:hypothetical protein